jgi:stage V sporulation protein B
LDTAADTPSPRSQAEASEDRGAGSDRSFGRDVAVLTVVRILGTAAGFGTSIVTARWLGPAELGLAGAVLTVGTIAALIANGGLNIASIYFLGRRPDQRDSIAARAFTLGLVASLLAAGIAVLLAALLRGLTQGVVEPVLLAAAAALGGGIVGYELNGSLLLGLGRRRPYVVAQVIEGIGSFVAAVAIVVFVAPTAAGYVLSAAVAFIAAAVYAAADIRRSIRGRLLAFDRTFTVESLALGLRGQVGNVLQFLNLRLDLLIVPWLLDLRAAGIYLIAVRMSEVVTQVAGAAAAFLFPAVARSGITATALTERTIRITLIVVGFGGLVIVLLAEPLLTLFFGADYAAGTSALRITMVAMIPLAITRILAGDLKGRGRPGLVSIGAGVALIGSVALDLLLIPVLGISGAALASVGAYGMGAVILLAAYRSVTGSSLTALIPTAADVRTLISVSARAGRSLVATVRSGD